MSKLWLVLLFCGMAAGHSYGQSRSEPTRPVIRGTINVVVADDQGIVVLTDSMLTETSIDAHGVIIYSQLPEPGRKLFQIDDRTVVTFAGFAAAATPSVPDFLNTASAIVGRYQDSVKDAGPMSVADKLTQLAALFGYYLPGVANIRDNETDDYSFELLIAGYDPDGTPEVGRLKLKMVPSRGVAGTVFSPVAQELRILPVHGSIPPLFAGIEDVANQIADNPTTWSGDKAIAAYAEAKKLGKPLTIEQMRAFAISVKRHTADMYRGVGGPEQVAVLRDGHVQQPLEQPSNLPAVPVVKFKFRIFDGATFRGTNNPSKLIGTYGALTPGCFPLYINNSFTGVRQEIGESYYSKNVFNESLLTYQGGPVHFEESNQVIQSDLLIGPKVGPNSSEVKQLQKDFQWRSVKFQREEIPAPFYFAGMVLGCGNPLDQVKP